MLRFSLNSPKFLVEYTKLIFVLVNNNMKIRYISFLMILVAFLSACSTQKKVIGNLTGPNPERARFESVIANNYKYEALQSKVKLSMGSSSLNGKICLESGKRLCLLVNAPLLGFEVARIEATADSAILVDKFDKAYTVVPLGELTQMEALAGHEMEALECLMLGRIFIPGKGQATSKDYGLLTWSTPTNAAGENPLSTGVYKGKNYDLAYTINSLGQLTSTSLTMADGKKAVWQYASYKELEKKSLPASETIKASNNEDKELQAGISFTNPTLGESTWRDFEPNASFRRVTLKELGEILKKMTK